MRRYALDSTVIKLIFIVRPLWLVASTEVLRQFVQTGIRLLLRWPMVEGVSYRSGKQTRVQVSRPPAA